MPQNRENRSDIRWKQILNIAVKNFGEHHDFGVVHPAQPRLNLGQSLTRQIPTRKLTTSRKSLLRQRFFDADTSNCRADDVLLRHGYWRLILGSGSFNIAPLSEQKALTQTKPRLQSTCGVA